MGVKNFKIWIKIPEQNVNHTHGLYIWVNVDWHSCEVYFTMGILLYFASMISKLI